MSKTHTPLLDFIGMSMSKPHTSGLIHMYILAYVILLMHTDVHCVQTKCTWSNNMCWQICILLRASCLTLEIKEFRCYEAKIEGSEKAGSSIMRVGGCPIAIAQWQSTGSSSCRPFHFPPFSPHNIYISLKLHLAISVQKRESFIMIQLRVIPCTSKRVIVYVQWF